jgi:hypothetical protein
MIDSTQALLPTEVARQEPSPAVPPDDPTRPSVRELLTELAALEDATRGPQGVSGGFGMQTPECLTALTRQQEIIDELHRRCPEASQPS